MIKRTIFFTFVTTMLLLVGCEKDQSSNVKPKEMGKSHSEINMEISKKLSLLDPQLTSDAAYDYTILNQVMEGLVRIGENGKVKEGIASSWEVSEDKKQYVFHLREANWSDGKKVSASDFEYAWKRALDPKNEAELSYYLYIIKGAEEFAYGEGKEKDVGVYAKDDQTLVVELNYPAPYFISLVSQPIFFPAHKEFVEKTGENYGKTKSDLIFNGPFVVEKWERGKSLVLKKNEQYWDKNEVKLEKANYAFSNGALEAIDLYETKKVDFSLISEHSEVLKHEDDYYNLPTLEINYVEFNPEKFSSFKNQKLRKAFLLATDLEPINEKLNSKQQVKGFVPFGVNGLKEDYRNEYPNIMPSSNKEEAKKLFQEALKEEGISSLPPIRIVIPDHFVFTNIAEELQKQWSEVLGVQLKLEVHDYDEALDMFYEGDFELMVINWVGDFNDPETFIHVFHSDYENSYYKNSKVDKKIEEAISQTDAKKRMDTLFDAEKTILDEVGVIPVSYEYIGYLKRDNIENFYTHSYGPMYELKWVTTK